MHACVCARMCARCATTARGLPATASCACGEDWLVSRGATAYAAALCHSPAQVGDMPEGTIICNVEEKAGDRGSLARCSGAPLLPLLLLLAPHSTRLAGGAADCCGAVAGFGKSRCLSSSGGCACQLPRRCLPALTHVTLHLCDIASTLQATTRSSWPTTPTPASPASSCPAAPRRCAGRGARVMLGLQAACVRRNSVRVEPARQAGEGRTAGRGAAVQGSPGRQQAASG